MKYLITLLLPISIGLAYHQQTHAIWPFKTEYGIDDTIINAAVGEKFEIELQSNPSTGYSWTADYDSAYLELREQEYERKRMSPPGTPGKEEWEFKTLRPGRTTITMTYKRPWEALSAKKKVFKVNIRLSGRTRDSEPSE
jgi:predicted secreted protein